MIAVAEQVCSDRRMPRAREEHLPLPVREGRSGEPDTRRQLEELFKEHSAFVARLVLRLLGRADEVDDLVQDVFVSLFRNLVSVREPAALRAWLITTTVRMVRRRLRVRRIGFLLGRSQRVDPATLPAQGSSAEDRLALWTIHRALQKVSVDARLAWILVHLEEEGIDAVARALGCSRSTAKRRVADAQREIKKALQP